MFNSRKHRSLSTGRRFDMYALTEGSFRNPTLDDDKPTSLKTMPLKHEKAERKAAVKKTGLANAAHGSNHALLVLFITVSTIFLTVLLLTLLMLFGKIGNGCGCSTDEGKKDTQIKLIQSKCKDV